MNKILVLILFSLLLIAKDGAVTKDKIIELYQKKEYEKLCHLGYRNFKSIRNDQNLISLYAFSCLYADYIDRLAIPIIALSKTKEARQNRTYFSLILTQKNMLYSSIIDHIPIEGIQLPMTDHVISRVSHLYFQNLYTKKDGHYFLHDPNDPKITYEVYQEKSRYNRPFLIIEEHIGSTIIKHKFL
ncbi:hypothetical protein [Nitratiruptor sp. SB155-2]|uniref:hypothetical protein n=1 Tax=Nitratiruptor sp. (strain SB155-2) TaxID=387092 RepID=UPI00015872B5|nr:hypothetical protein [Nitratiruptor sp. SB155-2]BAF70119.1 hypothetical protein NIS_1009 [Nitratiruptor sp. SB155-2]